MVEWSELLSGLVGSLIGGALAIVGTLWGAHLQHQVQAKLTDKTAAAEIAGYMGALDAEITVLWNSFQTRVRPALDAVADGQVFDFRWPAYEDYFAVYNGNAHLLGRVPDVALRTLIVTTYTATKGMLDSLGYNGEAARQLSNLRGLPNEPAREAQIRALTAELVDQARGLKASSLELEGLIAVFLPRLRHAAASRASA